MQAFYEVNEEIRRLTAHLLQLQREDGTWRFCFDNGVSTDSYMIILLRSLQKSDESLIRQLHDRILSAQQADGAWKLFADEKDGNLSASVEAYYALLYSGYSRKTEDRLRKARQFIITKGGIRSVNGLLTKVILATTGQCPWPTRLMIPLEFLLLPSTFPISFFDFSGYARVHLAPILLLADRRFTITTAVSPDLSDLLPAVPSDVGRLQQPNRGLETLLEEIQAGLGRIVGFPKYLHQLATRRAELYMLQRIEPDGTLYSYASSSFLMIFALLALGYDRQNPIILRAVQGLTSMVCRQDGKLLLQNSPSTVWDTALLSYALQEAGVTADSPAIRRASAYLLSKQHRKIGDWSMHMSTPVPGGWGFSDSNTINPDVDDTTAALRAIRRPIQEVSLYHDAANKGLNWIRMMQNEDGGWPAFERGKNSELLTWLPFDGAKSAAIDPSSADLTGRTLEYLGNTERLTIRHDFIRQGVDWLIDHQEENGSWYGRWGVCYIYGTWAALTGMMAVGVTTDHASVKRAISWLLDIQNEDGGWGESCRSDQYMRYIPLGASTLSQTAWALDTLIPFYPKPLPEIDRGIAKLMDMLHTEDWTTSYPTGAGLPGTFYIHYQSYRYIWPLLALSHYRKKYGG
jgi:sporulenol synthase